MEEYTQIFTELKIPFVRKMSTSSRLLTKTRGKQIQIIQKTRGKFYLTLMTVFDTTFSYNRLRTIILT